MAARVATTLNADNPDLSAFRARGGKLIIDNGWMDASLSPYYTLDYYERVLALDPTARNDVRLFLRPGVTHCRLGPGPDGTTILRRWMHGWTPARRRSSCPRPTGILRVKRLVAAGSCVPILTL
jgi:hypothetical protein